MLTYEDLVAAGSAETNRINFVLQAIGEHKGSPDVDEAIQAQAYYDGENPTITRYEKIIYDLSGRAHVDMWTANHKVCSSFFTFVVDQAVSYLLGNGVRFSNNKTKDRLGKDFDQNMMDALEYALIGGRAFVYWTEKGTAVFKYTEFKPLYGEETGKLMAGIRFWQLANDKPLQATLYEPDGFTQFSQKKGEVMKIVQEKKPYKQTRTRTKAEGVLQQAGENYASLPIVPLYAAKNWRSALHGHRNNIDALDFSQSAMVNNVDEGALIYWVLTNCGGMDDLDDAKFIERIHTTHVAHADGDAGATAEAKTVEAPFEGTKVTVDMLRDQLYDDFQAFDAKSISANDMSATAIKAAYVRLDMKTDKLERQVTRCINGILELAGIDDDPTYQRNQLINKSEEIQGITMQAEYFDEEYIREKLLAINGDIDMLEEINKRIDAEGIARINGVDNENADV